MPLEHAQVTSRMLVILIIVVGLISTVGLIINAIAMNQPEQPHITISQSANSFSSEILNDWLKDGFLSHGATDGWQVGPGSAGGRAKRDIAAPVRFQAGYPVRLLQEWTVAIGPEQGAHSYIGDDDAVRGFSGELVNAVCTAAKVQCHVVVDRFQNCWDGAQGQHPYGGQGLLGGWYDGCIGWTATTARKQVFDFTSPYTETPNAYLFTSVHSDISEVDINSARIGFVTGWSSNEKCLTKSADGNPSLSRVVYKSSPTSLVQALIADTPEVDAIFVLYEDVDAFVSAGLLKMATSGGFQCSDGGHSVMTRKDSQFSSVWAQGMDAIRRNGVFGKLCADATEKHGHEGKLHCLH